MNRRRRSPLPRILLRALFAIVGLAVLLVVVGVGAAMLLIDANRFKPDIEAAARRPTGRAVSLRGPLHFGFGLPPTLEADDIVVANVPGGSRPEMLTLQRLAARVALLPLLRGEIDVVRLDLIRPDLLLETDAAGHGNWQFAPPAPATVTPAPQPSGAPASATASGKRFALQALHIRDGHVAWRDGRTGRTTDVSLPRLDAEGSGPNASLVIGGEVAAGGRSLALSGETGSIARLLDRTATTPWLAQVIAQNDTMRLAANGSLLQPLAASGYSLQVDATATDLAAIAPLLPAGQKPPHDLSLSAHITDAGGGTPAISAITLHLDDLHLPLPAEVEIVRADVSAPALDKPLHADVQANYRGAPLHVVVDGASLAALRPGGASAAPVPLAVALESGGAHLAGKGTVALQPLGQGDIDMALSGRVPDLAALAPLVGQPLPALQQVAFDGHLTGNLAAALALHKLRLTMPQVQLTGDLDLTRAPRLSVRGAVQAQRVDLDGLLVAFAPPGTASPPPPPAAPPVAAAPPSKSSRVIPDEPLDLSTLDRMDADLQVSVAALQTGGVGYSDIAGHLLLRAGKLAIDPLAGATPGGRLDGKLMIDAHAAEAPMAFTLHAPSLALQPVAAAFGAPAALTGTAWVDVSLHGAGRTPHAIAASLDGRLGLALVDGEIDGATLALLLGPVLRTARFPDSVLGTGGGAKLRCLAVRLDAKAGVVTVPVLVADATRLLVQGTGDLDLGQETLNLRLRPLLRLGPGLVVPVHVGGSFREPRFGPDPSGIRAGVLGALAAIGNGEHAADACPPALAAVRGPDAPPLAPVAPSAAPGKPPKPIDVLRGLLH